MPQVAGASQLERITQAPERSRDDAPRAKLTARLAPMNELLRGAASLEAVTAAIGRAALMLTGASRCAVFVRTPAGAVTCPWFHQLSDSYVGGLCTPAGPNAWAHLSHHLELACMDLAARGRARSTVPSIIEDIAVLPAGNETRRAAIGEGLRAFCSWPLGRGGRVFGAVAYFFDEAHVCGDQEREVLLAFVLQASASLERVLAAGARTQPGGQPAAPSDRVDPKTRGTGPEMNGGTAAPAGAPAREIETETARLVMLQRIVHSEASRLSAEQTNLRAEREQLAAAQRELDVERERLAGVRRALDAEQERLRRTQSAHAQGAEAAIAAAAAARAAMPPAPAVVATATAPVDASAPSAAVAVQHAKTGAVERAYLDSVDKYRERVGRWAAATAAALRCSVNEIAEIHEAVTLLYNNDASSRAGVPLSVAAILRHREERWDGKGQPDGLAGSAIPLGARLLAVTLAYAEMVIGCPGSPMLYYLDAKAALRRDAGMKFDPEVVKAFCRAVDRT